MRHVVIASILGLALAGCPDRTISSVSPEQGRVDFKDIPVKQQRDIDILFVIDDSGSMQDKQNNLRDNFPKFIEVLQTIEGGLPDVHIGVVTSDVGTKGEEDTSPGPAIGNVGQGGCSGLGRGGNLQTFSAGVTGTFISDIKQSDGTRQTNYNGNLATVFGNIAAGAGASSCGFEQHLHAMKRALNNNPANTGFIRPEAFLAVIFLADEDDCSMSHSTLLVPDNAQLGSRQSFRCTRFGVTCDVNGATDLTMNQVGGKDQCHPNDNSQFLGKVSDYVKFLKGLKPDDPTKLIVAGIMGNPAPFQVELRTPSGGGTPIPALAHSCTYESPTGPQVADPPIRLKFFLDQFPNRSTFTTICQADLSAGLQLIAQLLKAALGDPCITSDLLDISDDDGLQPNCSVSYVFNSGKKNQTETILPECNAGTTNKPCWHVIADQMKCPDRDHLILKIEDDEAQADGTHIVSGCEANVN